MPIARALAANRDYLNEIRRVDISRASGRRRDPIKVGRLLRSLARNVATPASIAQRMKRGGRGEPSALAVVLPGGYGYVGGGDVGVVPIGALGP